MKQLTLAILALGTFSVALATPPPQTIVRDCARQLCQDIRNCTNPPRLVGKNTPAKDVSGKTSEQSQGRDESCYATALWNYQICSSGKPPALVGKTVTKPHTTEKTNTQSK